MQLQNIDFSSKSAQCYIELKTFKIGSFFADLMILTKIFSSEQNPCVLGTLKQSKNWLPGVEEKNGFKFYSQNGLVFLIFSKAALSPTQPSVSKKKVFGVQKHNCDQPET